MSMDIAAKLIAGVQFNELFFTDEGFWRSCDNDPDLTYVSPYYDAPQDKWIVGYSISEADLERGGEMVDVTKLNFEKEYGIRAHVFITPDVS